eukprot:395639-Rhodomonas_salina.1
MALALGFENCLYLPLIGLIPGHPVMEDTYDDQVFQFIVYREPLRLERWITFQRVEIPWMQITATRITDMWWRA